MSSDPTDLSRRKVLKATGAGAGFAGATGASNLWGRKRFNVGLESGVSAADAVSAARDVEMVREFDSLDIATVEMPASEARGLRAASGVRFVERDHELEALGQTTPWGIDRVDADVAHAEGVTGEGADVAIIDTGIDDDHVDDEFDLGKGVSFDNCGDAGFFGLLCAFFGNGNSCNEAWSDDNKHGTHCAGIAGALGTGDDDGVVGVGPGVTLHAVKVLNCIGSGQTSNIAKGIEWVADEGIDVASLSLGGTSSQTLKEAVEYAASQGVTIVAAAGNDGECTDCVSAPASYPEVLAVSATNCNDELASFSSQGPEIDIAAPGADVYSTVAGGYSTLSGTSMACPHVSGAAGVLAGQGYSREEIHQKLKGSAEDVGLGDNESGAGLLDVAAATGLDSSDDGLGNGPNC